MKCKVFSSSAFAALSLGSFLYAAQALDFEPDKFTLRSVSSKDGDVSVRAYENVIPVRNPADTGHQKINIYIPAAYFSGKSVNGYSMGSAPILLMIPSVDYGASIPETLKGIAENPKERDKERGRGEPPAFSQGAGSSGDFGGGPGMGGGSGGFGGNPGMGGGMPPQGAPSGDDNEKRGAGKQGDVPASPMASALAHGFVVVSAGTRGNDSDDVPAPLVDLKAVVRYLKYNDMAMPGDAGRIVATGERGGGAFALLLGVTGNAREYQSALDEIGAADVSDDPFAVAVTDPEFDREQTMTAAEWESAYHLKNARFGDYVNALAIKGKDGSLLSLDSNGNGPFMEYLRSFLLASAQRDLNGRKEVKSMPWLVLKNGKIAWLNLEEFAKSRADRSDYSKSIKLPDPLTFANANETNMARFWWIRKDVNDERSPLSLPLLLSAALSGNGANADMKYRWNRDPGNNAANEIASWVDSFCK